MLERVTVDTLTEVGAPDGAENSICLVTVISHHCIQRYTLPAHLCLFTKSHRPRNVALSDHSPRSLVSLVTDLMELLPAEL